MSDPNEIVITVRARTDVREGFAQAQKAAENAGQDAGTSYTDKFTDTVTFRMRERIAAPLAKVGDDMGKTLGEHTARGMAQVVARGVAQLPAQVGAETDQAGQGIGDQLGESIGQRTSQRVKDWFGRFGKDTQAETERSGDEIGNTMGGRIRDRIREKVRDVVTRVSGGGDTDVHRSGGIPDGGDKDTDKNGLQRWLARGKEAATAFAQGFGSAAQTFFSGDLISLLVKTLAGGALVSALAPALGAAVSAAVLLGLGGGVIGAGIASAFKDPRIQGAAKDLKTKLSGMFEEFGKPFRSPVANFLEKFAGFADRLAPKLKDLSTAMAPLVDKLGDGFIDALDKAMPGILDAVEASAPLFETLAKHLPQIGESIGGFFEKIAGQGDDANLFFDDLLTAIERIIDVLGTVISVLTSMYDKVSFVVHASIGIFGALWGTIKWGLSGAKEGFLQFALFAIDQLGRLLAGASAALSWIPGIGGKLKGAERTFNAFRKNVNDELGKIRDKTVTIRMRVLGLAAANAAISVGQTLSNMGFAHGGIVGSAASGGLRNGLTLVGEHGPELAEIAPGGRVHSNPDTMRMLGAGGGGGIESIRATWEPSGSPIMDVLAEGLRLYVTRVGGGDVQIAFGR
jgi:hypothetical protein